MANEKVRGIDLRGDFDTTKESLAVGDRMKDGTVVVAVDVDSHTALFSPEEVVWGKCTFEDQTKVVSYINSLGILHGHTDWRNATDQEASELAKNWNKVAPPQFQGDAAPWFWSTKPYKPLDDNDHFRGGRVYRASDPGMRNSTHLSLSRVALLPIVRSGPARS